MKYFLAVLAAILLIFNTAAAKYKFPAPNPSTEFAAMDFAPVYPTYSWEPLPNTEFYLVQVLNSEGAVVREMLNTESLNRVTDWQAFNEVGNFYWRVCVVDKNKKQLSEWSEPQLIEVTAPVTFAAFGDSITHGGANFIPAGQISCQWETYCYLKIKNIGRSGDTTAMLIERFERDVLPFQPKLLLIMGGVNDIREGATADAVIKNLEILREKCAANNIVPVFCTLTPMNEEIMTRRGIFFKKSWKAERAKINAWILKNGGVDVSIWLTDDSGELRADFTPDGLHPDARGKMAIGNAVGKFIRENWFNFITGEEIKEWEFVRADS